MLIIVGLGNPTSEYEKTYHNMGFMALDKLAEKLNKKITKKECFSLTSVFSVKGEKIVLAKPQTYMNLSGEAVSGLMKKFGADISELIVVYDDIDIDKCTVRARLSGSAGTHNGMKNIVEHLGSQNFKRVRVGIGKNDRVLKDFVLSTVKGEDKEAFENTLTEVADQLKEYIYNRDFDKFMRAASRIGRKEQDA